MSRIHLRSNTLVLWLSLTAAVSAASIGVGCSSSDSGGTAETGGAAAGKGGKSGATAGAPATDAGDSSVGGTDNSAGGADDTPGAGSGGKVAAGGAEPTADAGDPGEGGAAGATPAGGGDETAAAITRTKALITGLPLAEQCPSCHQPKYDGFQYWANITPDPVHGIGDQALWTDQAIEDAIHLGVDPLGRTLCSQMTRYPFSKSQLDDFVIFLRSLAPSTHAITSACPLP
jgi:hypothetical protein